MADEKFAGQSMYSSDFLKVLFALKDNIMRDLHVASFAKVTQVNNDGTCLVSLFPLIKDESDKNLQVTNYSSMDINIGDIVLILFLDRNYTQNFKQVKLNQNLTPLTDNKNLHSQKYGVIISSFAGGSGGGGNSLYDYYIEFSQGTNNYKFHTLSGKEIQLSTSKDVIDALNQGIFLNITEGYAYDSAIITTNTTIKAKIINYQNGQFMMYSLSSSIPKPYFLTIPLNLDVTYTVKKLKS